jgi:hypothetical protein
MINVDDDGLREDDDDLGEETSPDPVPPAAPTYRVPTGFYDGLYPEMVTARSVEAACAWDARLWTTQPGPWR